MVAPENVEILFSPPLTRPFCTWTGVRTGEALCIANLPLFAAGLTGSLSLLLASLHHPSVGRWFAAGGKALPAVVVAAAGAGAGAAIASAGEASAPAAPVPACPWMGGGGAGFIRPVLGARQRLGSDGQPRVVLERREGSALPDAAARRRPRKGS